MDEELMALMTAAMEANDKLFYGYNHMAGECHRKGDLEGYDYWLERTCSIIRTNRQIEKDITKLEKEAQNG